MYFHCHNSSDRRRFLRSPLEVVPLNAISNALGGTTSTPVAFARRKIVFLELISMIDGLLDITFSPRGAT